MRKFPRTPNWDISAAEALTRDGEIVECLGQCQKVGLPFFRRKSKLGRLSNHTLKKQSCQYHSFYDFWLRERIVWDWEVMKSDVLVSIHYKKWKPDVLILFQRFYDPSVPLDPLSKSKIVKFVIFVALLFNCDSTCNLTVVPASIYYEKMAAKRFDTVLDILWSLSLAQSLLNGQKGTIWDSGNQRVML